VLQRPRPVFVALRDTGSETVADRAEPVLAIVLLAGIALVLQTHTAAHLLETNDYDGLLIAIWAFLAGSFYGGFGYWVGGAFLYGSVRLFGSEGDFRRSRHVLAFAAVPIVLSLVLWPVKLALYGEDWFRSGGRDTGAGAHVFAALDLACLLWAGVLLVIGVRAVHGWRWGRSLAACTVGLGGPVVLGILLSYA
jgi:hypothetical protein